jgi:hypothetical protein
LDAAITTTEQSKRGFEGQVRKAADTFEAEIATEREAFVAAAPFTQAVRPGVQGNCHESAGGWRTE